MRGVSTESCPLSTISISRDFLPLIIACKSWSKYEKSIVKFQRTTRKKSDHIFHFSQKYVDKCYFTYLHWKKYVTSWEIKNIEQNKSLV